MLDEPNNPFAKIVSLYAERLADAPGAGKLARLAQSAMRIPEPLLDDVAALILLLDDGQLVGDDIAIHLIDIAYCDVQCADAVHFLAALRKRLQRYVDNPQAADVARAEFTERVTWWRMALSRAAELCRWPAIVLRENADKAVSGRYDVTMSIQDVLGRNVH